MDEAEIDAILRKEDDRPAPGIHLVVISNEIYPQAVYSLLKHFQAGLNYDGVYVTLSVPFAYLKGNLRNHGVDVGRLFFIDGVSKANGMTARAPNCAYIEDPHSLAELSLALTDAVQKQSCSFALFDSFSTLAVYNDSGTSMKFAEFFDNKLRNLGKLGIIITVDEKTAAKLKAALAAIADKTVTIGPA